MVSFLVNTFLLLLIGVIILVVLIIRGIYTYFRDKEIEREAAEMQKEIDEERKKSDDAYSKHLKEWYGL